MVGANAEILGFVATYRAVDAPAGRLIFIGDIHGCYDELADLLDRVAPSDRDVVVSCGDIVRKGPAVERCLDLWRERGYLAVLGNNELRVLRYGPLRRMFSIRGDLLDYIRTWPLMIDFERENISAVHGGVLPGTDVSASTIHAQRTVVYRLRYVRKDRDAWRMVPKGQQREGDKLWAEVWRGNRTILYGHTPLRAPRFDKKAIGLDTGCVYGGMLTAAIHQDGEWNTVSVKAHRQYSR